MRKQYFAVVTVVKNDLAGLKKSRASLESQTYKNWIHIILDGGSTDGTLKYLKSLPPENTIFVSESDNGIYDAMNKAWKFAHPESYVYFLNARDTFADRLSLSKANRALKVAGNPLWGCCTHEEMGEDGDGWVCKLVGPPSVPNQLYAFGYRSHQAVLMKASLIAKLGGFDEKYRIAADWDLIARALLNTRPATWFYPLGRFELGGMSSSRLLDAHMELREIRKRLLWEKARDQFYDDVWCAIYLRTLGFSNYLSRFLNFLYPTKRKIRSRSETPRHPRHFKLWLGNRGIQFSLLRRRIPHNLRINPPERFRMIMYLHRKLSISPYIGSNLPN